MFLNIRSISKIIDKFYHEFFDDESQYDFLCFAKTRLYPAIIGLHNIPNFNLFSNERNSQGGGVCIYANKRYSVQLIPEATVMLDYLCSF